MSEWDYLALENTYRAVLRQLGESEQENERLREGLRRIEIKAHDDLLAAEQENERLRHAAQECGDGCPHCERIVEAVLDSPAPERSKGSEKPATD